MVAKDPRMVTAELMNPYEKPPSMSVGQSMRTFLYNRETGAFMGRTASSWGKRRQWRSVASFQVIAESCVGIYHGLDGVTQWGQTYRLSARYR